MNFLERQLEDPVRFEWIKRLFYIGLIVVALAEIVLPRIFHGDHGDHFRFEKFPAWSSLYGLAACVAIIVVSKFLGKMWLLRREDYYDS